MYGYREESKEPEYFWPPAAETQPAKKKANAKTNSKAKAKVKAKFKTKAKSKAKGSFAEGEPITISKKKKTRAKSKRSSYISKDAKEIQEESSLQNDPHIAHRKENAIFRERKQFINEVPEFTPEEQMLDTKSFHDRFKGISFPSVQKYCHSRKYLEILIVAEKPAVSRAISLSLNDNPSLIKGTVNSYSFQSQFLGWPANFICTSVIGHIYSKDFPKKYRSKKNDVPKNPFKLFDMATVNLDDSRDHRDISSHLTYYAKDADIVILWTDCDNEGENICFEIINIAKRVTRSNIFLRARFSSLSKQELKKAFIMVQEKLYLPNLLKSLSVNARQIIDLKVGVIFTRFQTAYIKKQYPKLTNSCVSYGPCQIPTLGFVVDRYIEIAHHKRKPIYYLEAIIENIKLTLKWDHKCLYSPNDIREFNRTKGIIVSLASDQPVIKERKKPYPLNTVGLLKLAVNTLKLSPVKVM